MAKGKNMKTKNSNICIIEHPLVRHNLSILRDEKTDGEKFRFALKRISCCVFLEATKNLQTQKKTVKTPICECECEKIKEDLNIIIAPILRAGMMFCEVAQEMMPQAHIHHLGMYRDERTLQPVWYYNKISEAPKNPQNTYVFVLDPMLATGNSALDGVGNFVKKGIPQKNITFVCLLAAPQGIERLNATFEDVRIVTCSIDKDLNAKGYIVPGLGDAGDRIFNTIR